MDKAVTQGNARRALTRNVLIHIIHSFHCAVSIFRKHIPAGVVIQFDSFDWPINPNVVTGVTLNWYFEPHDKCLTLTKAEDVC